MRAAVEPYPDTIPTRASLLVRLKDQGDQASWKTFFDTYWGLIYQSAIKAGLQDAEAQDVVQETVLAVLRQIPSFDYNPEIGSFKGWLLRLTKWKISNQFRKRSGALPLPENCADDDQHGFCAIVSEPQFEKIWDDEWERNLLEAATERVKALVSLKHYQVFDLCVLRGWTVPRAATTLNMSMAGVYMVKHRVSKLLRMEIESLRTKPL